LEWAGKRVLEVGLGLGADSEQIVRRGGRWSGVDLTEESVDVVRTRFDLHALPYERLEVASVIDLPFDAHTFDVVYSFGVLHHVPQVRDAQREIARVLKPGGRLVAMLYAKHSANYWISIALVRRAAVAAVCPTGRTARGLLVRTSAMQESSVCSATSRWSASCTPTRTGRTTRIRGCTRCAMFAASSIGSGW